ncbi:MAG TPA: class II fructose-bisphosphate aldolase [Candidatus Staskawiczbacteria bacterium]|nr:class II fructose-bisphosphate aldolase [Candidatus Staskawiczbacteria bacterium]
MKPLKFYLEKAQKQGFAVPQFNFSDFSEMKAIVKRASELKSPIILGTSEGESKFFGLDEAVAIRDVLRKKTGLPIFLNLDHGKTLEYIRQAIDAGYDMVHFDGSKLPLEENIKITKEVKKYIGWKNVLLEGEVGRLGTDASRIYTEELKINEADLTKPEEALKYISETKVDLLAVGIGNFHGVQSSGIDPELRIDVLESIKEVVGGIGIVLHGGSGTPESSIKHAVQNGVVKININTELRIAFANGLKESLLTGEIVPYKYLPKGQEEVEKIVEQKVRLFSSMDKV